MTTTNQFKKFAKEHYEKAFYNNVMFLVKRAALPEDVILDACCGPGLFSKRLVKEGYRVVLFDENKDYLKEAKKVAPKQQYVQGDILKLDLSDVGADCVVFTNVSGYFSPKELEFILTGFPGNNLIANFFVEEDQKWAPKDAKVFLGCRGRKYSFSLGSDTLDLTAIREKELVKVFRSAGYSRCEYIYTHDFKTERLYLLER